MFVSLTLECEMCTAALYKSLLGNETSASAGQRSFLLPLLTAPSSGQNLRGEVNPTARPTTDTQPCTAGQNKRQHACMKNTEQSKEIKISCAVL